MDVLVAGAGPVGLFTAHALAKEGVSVNVVDTGIWPCSHSYALALHPSTVDLLCKAGLSTEVLQDGNAIHRAAIYDEAQQRGSVVFPGERPVLVLPQSALEAGLEKALDTAGVHTKWRHSVTAVESGPDSAQVTLNRYEKESRGYVIARSEWAIAKTWTEEVKYVVGCDGYGSTVRQALGISFPEVGASAYYAVFEFQSDLQSDHEVRVILGKETTDVLWPLGDGWFRWSFELPGYVDAEVERFAAARQRYGDPTDRIKDRSYFVSSDASLLPDQRLPELIAARAPWFKGTISEVAWRTIVRFERRLATSYGRDRCWLAGDAAHLGTPLGVQSLNVGLAEARDLAAALIASLGEGKPSHLLAEYNARYLSEWKRLQGIERTLEQLPGVDPWIWEQRDRLLACLPGHGEQLQGLAKQIGIQLND